VIDGRDLSSWYVGCQYVLYEVSMFSYPLSWALAWLTYSEITFRVTLLHCMRMWLLTKGVVHLHYKAKTAS
jgi:hypothetical protein